MTIESKMNFCSASLAVLLAASLLAAPGAAFAQAIERNLPPAPKASETDVAPASLAPADQDAAPIGPALSGLVTLGAGDAAQGAPAAGLDVGRTPRLKPDLKVLQRFLGRPLSKKLIAQVEAEIANAYRRAGFPFVNLTTPPQQITSGVLQVRVVEFHLASKTAAGASPGDTPYIESRVRVARGQPIDADLLAQDLDWLNRFPFRKTQAVLTPAATPGGADLMLQTTPSKPWSVYAGYADSGSPLTGLDRYFTGFQSYAPGLHDALLCYQFTGSPDALAYEERPFASAPNPQYVSHAGRLVVPTLAREDIEASIDFVQSNQPVKAFYAQQTTEEGTLDYRSALSNFVVALPGEVLIGVEAKREDSRTSFDGAVIKGAGVDVFQVLVGYAYEGADALGETSVDLNLHMSPGGVDDRNTASVFTTFSAGRFSEATYAYLNGDFTRYTQLPTLFGFKGAALIDTVIFQYSAQPLPQTEEMGVGDASLVRGYTLDDGAFDTAIVSRNALRPAAFTVLRPDSVVSPYVFFDKGYGQDQATRHTANPTSAGLGLDYQLGAHLAASVDGAWVLNTAGLTHSGDSRMESRITLTF